MPFPGHIMLCFMQLRLLFAKGLSAKSHSGIINIFGHEIVEKSVVSRELGRILNKAHALRQKSDYDANADFELADVEKLIEEARYFLAQIRQAMSTKGK
jgi:uncharacterized protein (UPF0332 family)